MADITNKTLKVAIQTDSADSVETFKLVRKELEGTAVAIKTLSSVMGKNEEGNLQYVHSIELISQSYKDLEKVLDRISKIKTGTGTFEPVPASTASSNLTKDIKAAEAQAAKDAAEAQKTRANQADKTSADTLDKVKTSINSQLIAIREGENSIAAIKNASAEKQKQIEAELQKKLKDFKFAYTKDYIDKNKLDSLLESATSNYKKQTLALATETDKRIAKINEENANYNLVEKALAATNKRIEANAQEHSKILTSIKQKEADERAKYSADRIKAEQELADKARRQELNTLRQDIEERNAILNAASKQRLGAAISDIMVAESSDRKKQLAELKQSMIERASLEDKDKKERLDRQAAVNRQLLENERIFAEELRRQELAEMRRRMESRVTMSSGFAAASANIYRPASDYSRSMIAGMSAAANPPAAQLPATPPAPDRKPWDSLLARILEINIAYRATNALLTEMNRVVHAIPKIGIELESTKASLTATMGDTGMRIALVELRKEAERTGMDIEAIRESFRSFSASTSLAGQSLESTWKMFQNINTTATALHFTTDKVTHTFLALSQMFNKGKVQSEELVKQLGNLLPGAFAAFQKANEDMFSSPQKLSEAMKQGTVTASETIEKFTTYYAERFNTAFQSASDGLNANMGRMNNSFTALGEAIYGVVGGPLNAFFKGVTELNKYLEAAIKGENDFILVSKTLIDVLALGIGASAIKAASAMAKAKYEIVALQGAMATAKTVALDLGLALKTISGPVILAGMASLVSYLHEINAARRESYDNINKETKAITENAKVRALTTPIDIQVENDPDVIAARESLNKFKKDRAKIEAQMAKDQSYSQVTGTFQNIKKAYEETNTAVKNAEEKLTATLETSTASIKAEREKQFEAFMPKGSAELDIAKQDVKNLEAKASILERKAYLLEKDNKLNEADAASLEALKLKRKAALQDVLNDNDKFIKENQANMQTNVKGILKLQQEEAKSGVTASSTEAMKRLTDELKKNSDEIVQVKEQQAGKLAEVETTFDKQQDAIQKKRESAVKKATSETEKLRRQDIRAEEQYNKTTISNAQNANTVLDGAYKLRVITLEQYFEQKQSILDAEYEAEKQNLEKRAALASQTGRKDIQADVQQQLARLNETKKAKESELDQQRVTRTEEYKTQLADIRDKYYQILGVESDDNEITKEKLRLLRQEIALRAAAGDVASQNSLKQFDTNEYNKGLFKQMAVAQQGMDANQNKLNEELARTNALENVGRVSSIQGALARTKANEQYIASQEKVIQNMEEELSKPSSFEKSNQLTEKIRKARAELENFKLTSNEVATAVEDSLGRAFESSFTGIMSGSMNASQAFKSFANSIGQDILKMAASAVRAQLLSPLIGAMFSGIGGMFSSAFGSSASVAAGNSAAFSGAMSGSNWMSAKLANGGVMSGAGISAYSGSIVSSPTVFPFAAGVGLMGEAGPEAVLPLKRNSQGKLGVTLENGGQSKGNVYNISVNVENKSGESGSQFGEKAAVAIMRTIAKEEIASAKRPGNQLNKSRFG